jgi:hypothetical protein
MSDERKYPIAYRIENKPHSKAQLILDGLGGCDAIVVASIMRDVLDQPEGRKSIAVLSLDGATGGDIPSTELFQVFARLAHTLAGESSLPAWQREIAAATIAYVRMMMQAAKDRQ